MHTSHKWHHTYHVPICLLNTVHITPPHTSSVACIFAGSDYSILFVVTYCAFFPLKPIHKDVAPPHMISTWHRRGLRFSPAAQTSPRLPPPTDLKWQCTTAVSISYSVDWHSHDSVLHKRWRDGNPHAHNNAVCFVAQPLRQHTLQWHHYSFYILLLFIFPLKRHNHQCTSEETAM